MKILHNNVGPNYMLSYLEAIERKQYSYVFDYSLDNNTSEHFNELKQMIYQMSQDDLDRYSKDISRLIVKYGDDELFDYFANRINYIEYGIYITFLNANKTNYINFLITNNKVVKINIIEVAVSHFGTDQKVEWITTMLDYLGLNSDDMRELGMRLNILSPYIDEKITEIFLGNDYHLTFHDFESHARMCPGRDSIKRWMEHGLKDEADKLLNCYIRLNNFRMIKIIVEDWMEYLTPTICILDVLEHEDRDIGSVVDILEYLKTNNFNLYYEERDILGTNAQHLIKIVRILIDSGFPI